MRKGGKKQHTSESHYKKDPDNGLLHSIAKGDETSHQQAKFLKQKQNHCYLKSCNLSCSVVFFPGAQGGHYSKSGTESQFSPLYYAHTLIKSFWNSWTQARNKQHPLEIEMSIWVYPSGRRKRFSTRLGVCSCQGDSKHWATSGSLHLLEAGHRLLINKRSFQG